MNRRIEVSRAARRDLIEIVPYLDAHSDVAGDWFLRDSQARFTMLTRYPAAGRPVTRRFTNPGALRRTRISPRFADYLSFYRAYQRHLRVVRILHAARDLEAILRL